MSISFWREGAGWVEGVRKSPDRESQRHWHKVMFFFWFHCCVTSFLLIRWEMWKLKIIPFLVLNEIVLLLRECKTRMEWMMIVTGRANIFEVLWYEISLLTLHQFRPIFLEWQVVCTTNQPKVINEVSDAWEKTFSCDFKVTVLILSWYSMTRN